MTSARFSWLLRDFVPEYHRAKFGCNWTTNKGETEGGTICPPAYMVPKDPSLNRVKPGLHISNPKHMLANTFLKLSTDALVLT